MYCTRTGCTCNPLCGRVNFSRNKMIQKRRRRVNFARPKVRCDVSVNLTNWSRKKALESFIFQKKEKKMNRQISGALLLFSRFYLFYTYPVIPKTPKPRERGSPPKSGS